MEYNNLVKYLPLTWLHPLYWKFGEPVIFPKTIPLHTIDYFITMYHHRSLAKTAYQQNYPAYAKRKEPTNGDCEPLTRSSSLRLAL